MKNFIYIILSGSVSLLPRFAFAATNAVISINTVLPGTNALSTGPAGWVANFYQYALLVSGLIAMGAITYGAVKYSLNPGNPSAQSDAKEWIMGSIYGIVLLAGAFIILHVINPNLTKMQLPSLPEISGEALTMSTSTPPTKPTASSTATCSDLSSVAAKNNEPYPAQNAPDLTQLISCVQGKVSGSLGSQFTYDHDHPSCNYTRGQKTCDSKCSHAVSSCHYGGHTGKNGAEAVDFGAKGAIGNQVIAAGKACGDKSARCENASAKTVACTDSSATHVHMNAASCDAN